MSRGLSVYLDLLRLAAAAAVYLDHATAKYLTGGALWLLGGQGQHAVLIFFVLSGFVIAYVTDLTEFDWRRFFLARAARLYSVALPALLLGGTLLLLRCAVTRQAANLNPVALFRCITFTNELWQGGAAEHIDGPYWSLGYEAPYYAVFSCAMFLRGVWRLIVPVLMLAAAGPRIAVLFPCWLAGVAAWRIARAGGPHLGRRAAAAAFIATLGATIALTLAWPTRVALYAPLDGSALQVADLLRNTAIACLLAMHLVAARSALRQPAGAFPAPAAPIARAIQWCAGLSFSLYLFHLPIMLFIAASVPLDRHPVLEPTLVFGLPALLTVPLAALTERRKAAWRALLLRLAGAVMGAASGAGPRPA